MCETKYRICLSAPLGQRNGTMLLRRTDGNITGWLELLGQRTALAGAVMESGQLELSGVLQTLVNTVPFTATGTVSGSQILLNLKTASGAYYPVSGEELTTHDEVL